MLGFEESTSIFDFLKAEQMIDARGKVQDKLRQALKEGTLTLPPEYAAHLPQVKEVLRKVAGKLEIGRASCRERVCQYVYISVVAGSLTKKTYTEHKKNYTL